MNEFLVTHRTGAPSLSKAEGWGIDIHEATDHPTGDNAMDQSNPKRKPVGEYASLMDFLPELLKRPAMFLEKAEASRLNCFLTGWQLCTDKLGFTDTRYEQFDTWLMDVKYAKGGSMRALSRMIQEMDETQALQWFKECFKEYVESESTTRLR
jgi:hypothetical protein